MARAITGTPGPLMALGLCESACPGCHPVALRTKARALPHEHRRGFRRFAACLAPSGRSLHNSAATCLREDFNDLIISAA
jgi:hypothetical protein